MLARLALASVSLVTVALPLTSAGPYAAPAALPALSPQTLTARYAAVRHEIERAAATSRRVHGTSLSAFLNPARRFLSFDARGSGRAVEVDGDLATADRVAVVVPGADNDLGNFDSWKFAGGAARALYNEARAIDPGTRVAVVAWLGYDSPSVLSRTVLSAGRAERAAKDLRTFVHGLKSVNAAPVDLLCHSYGSVICAKAANGLPVADIAMVGSPGTTVGKATDLRTPARVWAARATGDWTQYVPNISFLGLGFGQDPTSVAYGAQVFDAGSGTHSEYFKPGSLALRNLSLIALGRAAA
jgi:hypothetical protein